MLRKFGAQVGHINVNLVQRKLNALVDGVAAGAARGRRGSVALTKAFEFRCAALLEILERLACGNDIRMVVGETKQQLIELGLRFVDARKGVETRRRLLLERALKPNPPPQ